MAPSIPAVELGRVVRGGGAPSASGTAANGYVVARRQAALSTVVQGRVVELNVEEGDRVATGQQIARLDTRQLEAMKAGSQHEIARLQAEGSRAQAAHAIAVTEEGRTRQLVEAGVLQLADLDHAQSETQQAASAVQSWFASEEGARASLTEIEVRIQNSAIYAPFAGVITQKNAEVGEVVSAIGATGPNARGSVATLVDFETLEVQVELAQTALQAAEVGAAVLIYLDAFPEKGYPGEVRQIWPTANRQKATVELRVTFLDRDDRILPEMGVRVVFAVAGKVPLAVTARPPKSAVADGYVFVYTDGLVVRTALDQLQGGEQVVLRPAETLQDGDAVRIIEE